MRSASHHLQQLMASSSSPKLKYGVFLSFHGEDTRQNITSHLHEGLCRDKIETFIDDNLIRGEEISPSLSKAIEHSKISVIIFSKGYASSKWCLKELEEIVKCKNKYDQTVIPVFYDVDPSDVRNQTGDFGNSFAKLENRFMDDPKMLQEWRTALRDAANLSGFHSKNYRKEATLVKDIVDDILKRLGYDSSIIDTNTLVGLDSLIEKIENLLCMKGVCKLGIWGIGGIGKTTLARVIFEKISKQFEDSYFIGNIREESEKSGGLNNLCQKLSSAVLGDKHSNHGFTFTRRSLISRTKVLIVFDDLTNLTQMKCLMRVFDNLGLESRIIITTRDKHVLTNCEVDYIHEMTGLSFYNALKLFALHALKGNPPTEAYIKLSSKVVAYAKGVPLALEVLGSFLFKRTEKEWESALKNLETSPHEDIQKVLKVSYDGLSDKEKCVFLDIVCFFKGYKRDLIEAILNACDFGSHICINLLIEKCLITTSSDTITMHDLLEEMGKQIVRQESNDNPGKRSRLWDHEKIFSVLEYNMGTEAIRSIRLDLSKVEELHLNPETFDKMRNLRFLEFYGSEHGKNVPACDSSALLCNLRCMVLRFLLCNLICMVLRFLEFYRSQLGKHSHDGMKVHGFKKLKFDFYETRYFRFDGYPDKSLPPNFNPRNLVALYMPYSKVKKLWTSTEVLINLKHFDLSYSKHLCSVPDFSLMPNLESLYLGGCTNLPEKSFSSIHNLHKLVILNLRGCKSFNNLPISHNCQSLREVNLSDCSNLETFPYLPDTVEELYIDETAIQEFQSIWHLSRLHTLSLDYCSRLERFSYSIRELKALRDLNLSGCSKLAKILSNIGQLISLEELSLWENDLEMLPKSIKGLSNLELLHLSDFKRLKYLPELPSGLRLMWARNCIYLESISTATAIFPRMYKIDFYNCSKLKLVITDALLNIEREKDTWRRPVLKNFWPKTLLCYPECEILEWFNLKSDKSYIEFPEGWVSDNLIGFVFCAIVSFQDRRQHKTFKVRCDLIVNEGSSSNRFPVPIVFDIGDLEAEEVIQSDHVFVANQYIKTFEQWPILNFSSQGGFEFYVERSIENGRNPVKKCGVTLLYAQNDNLRRDVTADKKMDLWD